MGGWGVQSHSGTKSDGWGLRVRVKGGGQGSRDKPLMGGLWLGRICFPVIVWNRCLLFQSKRKKQIIAPAFSYRLVVFTCHGIFFEYLYWASSFLMLGTLAEYWNCWRSKWIHNSHHYSLEASHPCHKRQSVLFEEIFHPVLYSFCQVSHSRKQITLRPFRLLVIGFSNYVIILYFNFKLYWIIFSLSEF